MVTVYIYFNNDEHIRIENVIMVETISSDLVVLYKVDCGIDYYNYTEIKRYPMSVIDRYVVKMN